MVQNPIVVFNRLYKKNIQGATLNWYRPKLSKYKIPLYPLALSGNFRAGNMGSCTQKIWGGTS